MKIEFGLSQKDLDGVADGLKEVLADTYALYLKTQNFHWNVNGENFFSLHLLFEKQYEEMAEAVDEIAERIRILGSYVEASFERFQQKTQIAASVRMLPAEKMLKELVEDHEKMSRHGRQLIARFEKLNDHASIDLLIRRLLFHEKAAWMLRSHLHK